jgi:enoyl-CoA hydratase
VGRLTLNRPKALHALTLGMCQAMTKALLEWRTDDSIEAVLLDHAGERGFCAGGDIKVLADSGASDGSAAREFFFVEYRLNHLLAVYPKPIVVVMDGVVMGGGVGVAIPAKFRIATERTTFAMPETDIGLFPDVGGGWFLPRLKANTGLWLALTSARIKAADCFALEIATHVVESAKVDALKAAVIARPGHIAEALAPFETDPGPAPIAARLADIERLFAVPSIEALYAGLQADGSEWAAAQLAVLNTKSPQAMKVTLRQLEIGGALTDLADNMVMEYRVGARVVRAADFIEGVRAVIVEKDRNPRWSPPTLEGVTEALLDGIFAPLPADQEWSPLPELSA